MRLRDTHATPRLQLKELLLVALLCAPVFFFNVFSSHDWGGDFAQYIAQAINMVEGVPMNETGYLYNPDHPWLAPPVYPVGYPLLLAPVYFFSGNSIHAFSMLTSLFIFLTGIASFAWFRRHWGTLVSLLLMIGLIYSPWLVRFKMEIRSDLPFTLFLLFFMLAYSRKSREFMLSSLLVGVLGGFLISIRSIGAIICIAVGFDFLQRWWTNRKNKDEEFSMIRHLRHPALVILGTVGSYLVISKLLFPVPSATAPYPNLFTTDGLLECMWLNLLHYYEIFKYFFFAYVEEWKIIPQIISYALVSMMVFGMLRKWILKFDWIDVLFLSYMGVLLVFPYRASGIRFILPVLPIALYYVCYGFHGIPIRLPFSRNLVAFILGGLLLFPYHVQLKITLTHQQDVAMEGPQKANAQALWQHIQEHTAKEDRFAFTFPRVLALYTGREALGTQKHQTPEEIERTYRAFEVDYIVVHEAEGDDGMKQFVVERPNLVKKVWETDGIVLYQLQF